MKNELKQFSIGTALVLVGCFILTCISWGFFAAMPPLNPVMMFMYIVITGCICPALVEEFLRCLSCQVGKHAAISFWLSIVFMEHFLIYQEGNFIRRLVSHGLLTALQYIGVKRKQEYVFLPIGMGIHFLHNFSCLY